MAESKLRFLGPARSQFWVKIAKNLREARVWCRTMKSCILRGYWLFWLPVNSRLTRGIFVILAEKGILGPPMSERVVPRHYGCSRGPMERIIFLDFSGSDTQIEVKQNMVSTINIWYSWSFASMKDIRKKNVIQCWISPNSHSIKKYWVELYLSLEPS